MNNSKFKKTFNIAAFLMLNFAFLITGGFAQELPPAPSAPRPVNIPKVQEMQLANGLKVVVVERKNVPLVTAALLIRSGASSESSELAGVADMTASMLLKGTKTRTASQIAEQIDFLGANINSGADWNSTHVSVNVTSDKLDQALAIMADTVLNPTFAPKEIELYKTQTLDELNVALKQPSSLAAFVAAKYSFGEHSALGTPETINKITQADLLKFYRENYYSNNAVLIFTGDITAAKANQFAAKYFGAWKRVEQDPSGEAVKDFINESKSPIFKRLLVVDLPNSGQAAVNYTKKLQFGRLFNNGRYFPSTVANAVLGGGYSARLNEEIRIKRGLSYGAGSNLAWRYTTGNFLARAQTKNVSAAEVAELVAAEIDKISTESVANDELKPRKATLTGTFGRELETTNGLVNKLAELYAFGLKTDELNSYMQNVESVSDSQIKTFAAQNLRGGDIIIVGDYKVFADDLKKRFPNQKIEVISASDLDLNHNDLRRATSKK